jgi:hypothetical protein
MVVMPPGWPDAVAHARSRDHAGAVQVVEVNQPNAVVRFYLRGPATGRFCSIHPCAIRQPCSCASGSARAQQGVRG